eukprot:4541396-Pleurochrysis_carterae.AAC.1
MSAVCGMDALRAYGIQFFREGNVGNIAPLCMLALDLARAFASFFSELAILTFSTSALVLQDRLERFTVEFATSILHCERHGPIRRDPKAPELGNVTSVH